MTSRTARHLDWLMCRHRSCRSYDPRWSWVQSRTYTDLRMSTRRRQCGELREPSNSPVQLYVHLHEDFAIRWGNLRMNPDSLAVLIRPERAQNSTFALKGTAHGTLGWVIIYHLLASTEGMAKDIEGNVALSDWYSGGPPSVSSLNAHYYVSHYIIWLSSARNCCTPVISMCSTKRGSLFSDFHNNHGPTTWALLARALLSGTRI